jgi:hypothetical protein
MSSPGATIQVPNAYLSASFYLTRLRVSKNKFTRPHFKQPSPTRPADTLALRLHAEEFDLERGQEIKELMQMLKGDIKAWDKIMAIVENRMPSGKKGGTALRENSRVEEIDKDDGKESKDAASTPLSVAGLNKKKLPKSYADEVKLKAKEAEQVRRKRVEAAITIQKYMRAKIARIRVGELRRIRRAAVKIKNFLKRLVNRRKAILRGLHNLKLHFNASVITNFMRKVCVIRAKERREMNRGERVRAFCFGIKTRMILKLPRMIETKNQILELESHLNDEGITEEDRHSLYDEIVYQKNLYANLFDKYWSKTISVAEELQKEKELKERKKLANAQRTYSSPGPPADGRLSSRRATGPIDRQANRPASRRESIDQTKEDEFGRFTNVPSVPGADDRPIKGASSYSSPDDRPIKSASSNPDDRPIKGGSSFNPDDRPIKASSSSNPFGDERPIKGEGSNPSSNPFGDERPLKPSSGGGGFGGGGIPEHSGLTPKVSQKPKPKKAPAPAAEAPEGGEGTGEVSEKVRKQKELMERRRKYDPRKAAAAPPQPKADEAEAENEDQSLKEDGDGKNTKSDKKKGKAKLDNITENPNEEKSTIAPGDEAGEGQKPKQVNFLKRKTKKIEFQKLNWSSVQSKTNCWGGGKDHKDKPAEKEKEKEKEQKKTPRAHTQKNIASPSGGRDLAMIKLKNEEKKKDKEQVAAPATSTKKAPKAEPAKKEIDALQQIEDTLNNNYVPKLQDVFSKEINVHPDSKIPVLKNDSKFILYIEETDLKDVLEELEEEYDMLVNI